MPDLIIMAAMSSNRVIGYQNKLPWHLPADLERVHQVSAGKTFIMGKKTFLSPDVILSSKKNIILTKQTLLPSQNETIVQAKSFKQALHLLQPDEQVLIMGGAFVYKQALSFCDRMLLTLIHHSFHGDTFFPNWNQEEWKLIAQEHHKADQENAYDYSFLEYSSVR
ncbi:MAG: dihydrofolate reductase [Flammeovirgaceae bacterium]